MTRIRKSAEDRKREIVLAAIRLAGDIGPDRLTTQHLADAVGLTQPAIFRHFATKSDIWLAVGEHIAKALSKEQTDPHIEKPLECLRDLVFNHLGSIARTPAIPAILFSRELHVENDQLRQHFEKLMLSRRENFAGLFAQARDNGEITARVAPADAAALVLATIQGIAMRWSLENKSFDLQAEGTRLITCLIDGFKPTAPKA